MTVTTLYIIRHASTDMTGTRMCGRLDAPLSRQGMLEAEALRARLSGRPDADSIITSPLMRAKKTAEIAFPGRDIEVCAGLIETDFGRWEGCTHAEAEEQDTQQYRAWCGDWIRVAPPEGESGAQLCARMTRLRDHLASGYAGRRVALVSHAAAMRMLLAVLLHDGDANASWRYKLRPARIAVVSVSDGYAMLEGLDL